MNLLISSFFYAPSIGGLETFSALMAQAFQRAGHRVTVVTTTLGDPAVDGIRVERGLGPRALLTAMREHDLVWQNGLSTQLGWPALLARRPLAITHLIHPWPVRGPSQWIRNQLLRRGHQISVSRYLAGVVPVPSQVIPNAFDAAGFAPARSISDRRGAIFLGRLVSDKGADRLLQGWARSHACQRGERLTLVGDGDERPSLAALAESLGIAKTVTFAGALRGDELVRTVAQHRLMVVPSVWQEPFGIVALEGLAAGCRVAVAARGGLPEALGGNGPVFDPDRPDELARVIDQELESGPFSAEEQERVDQHLAAHHPDVIAGRYLMEFERWRAGR